jgi:hypothetical protein
MGRVCNDTPRPIRQINPDIPEWLVAITDRLLAKEPEDRFKSAEEVCRVLSEGLAYIQDATVDSLPASLAAIGGAERRASAPKSTTATRGRRWAVAAVLLIPVLALVTLSEATGVTKMTATVIRIAAGEGTLVIEVDDPTVRVSLDGEELSITGAGMQELKLRPGRYEFQAIKDGEPVKQELVTITRGGRQVVRVTREPIDSHAASAPELVSVRRIWDRALHCAFTDLIWYNRKWYCTFREGVAHSRDNGKVRVALSVDGEQWESAALLAEPEVDLRDPKLSITPDGRLMMVMGGTIWREGRRVSLHSRVAFSENGHTWTPTQTVLGDDDWLWRITWHDGKAYGVSCNHAQWEKTKQPCQTLVASSDGVNYDKICTLDVPGFTAETTLRFQPDGTMIALVRQESPDKHGWVGTSRKPYDKWDWCDISHRLGGPNFIILPDGSMWAGSRLYSGGTKTVLARMTPKSYEPVLTLPSGGDTSYPGLGFHDGLLWMSYYASHEEKTSIYLATIRLPSTEREQNGVSTK